MQRCGIADLSHPLHWYLLAPLPLATYACEVASYQEPNRHIQVFEHSTFWCPTDSCRNRSIPVDSTGVRQESTGMEVNPEEWKSIHRNRRSIQRNGSQSTGMEINPEEWKSIQRNGSQSTGTGGQGPAEKYM